MTRRPRGSLETVFAPGSTGLQTIGTASPASTPVRPEEQATQSVIDYAVEVLDDADAVLAPAGVQIDAMVRCTRLERSARSRAAFDARARFRWHAERRDRYIRAATVHPRHAGRRRLQVGVDNTCPVLHDAEVSTYELVIANAGRIPWPTPCSTTACPPRSRMRPGLRSVTLHAAVPDTSMRSPPPSTWHRPASRFDIVARVERAPAPSRASTCAPCSRRHGDVQPANDVARDDEPDRPIGVFGDRFDRLHLLTLPAAQDALKERIER